MNDNRPIVFFDSGVGGLPYLKLALQRLPLENYIYIADRKNYPYGHRTAAEIRKIVIEAVAKIIAHFNPKLITIACNTASVVALEALRKTFKLPFVGVVPAIKPAAKLTRNGRVGVLATEQTLNNEYIARLIKNFAAGCNIILIAANELRDIIEERFFYISQEKKRSVVKKAVDDAKAAKVDALVLACTHFLHVESEFQELLDNSIRLVDSRNGVISQLERVLKNNNLSAGNKKGTDQFFLTASSPLDEHYKKYASWFKLNYSGAIG
jgi:glutamate racemase